MKTKYLTIFFLSLLFVENIFAQTPWTYVNTGVSADIIFANTQPNYQIPTINGTPIENGDYIGVFFTTTNGCSVCAGYAQWSSTEAFNVRAFGDDTYTSFKDGFSTGNQIVFRIFDVSENAEYEMTAVFHPYSFYTMTTWTTNGLAVNPTLTSNIEINLSSQIEITYNGNQIQNNDNTPSLPDGTDFGSVNAGEQVIHTFQIKNTGTQTLCLYSSPIVESTDFSAQFSVLTQPTLSTLNPDQTTSFQIKYQPTGIGSHNTLIKIFCSAPDNVQFIFYLKAECSLTTTWNGSTSNSWNNTANWSNGIPNGDISAIISGNTLNYFPIISNTASCKNLTLQAGSKLTLSSSGELLVNGNLNVLSNSEATAHFINKGLTTISGTSVIERNLSFQDRWYYITSPIENAVAQTIDVQNNFLFEYNQSLTQYEQITDNNSTLNAAKGYVVRLTQPATLQFEGILNNSEVIANVSNDGNGWNLIGNPFTTAVDWDSEYGIMKENINDAIYFRSNGVFYTYVNGIGVPFETTGIIPSMQAFWVKAIGAGNIVFMKEAMIDSEDFFYKKEQKPIVRINAETELSNSETVIYKENNASESFDSNFDALLFYEKNTDLQIYTQNNDDNFVINAIDFQQNNYLVPLFIETKKSGGIVLNFNVSDEILNQYNVYFTNNTSQQNIVEITKQIEALQISQNQIVSKYYLIFSKKNQTSVINNNYHKNIFTDGKNITIFNSNNYFQTCKISLKTVQGIEIYTDTQAFSTLYTFCPNLKAGFYVINVKSEKFDLTEKIIIK